MTWKQRLAASVWHTPFILDSAVSPDQSMDDIMSTPPTAVSRTKWLVNADDFGLSVGVNHGIIQAYQQGIIRSTTLMANMPAFDHAVELAKDHPGLGVGVHLNLSWGQPVSKPALVSTLVKGNGDFYSSLLVLAGRIQSGLVDINQVELEFKKQIQKVCQAGIVPTHLDTHKHIHLLPTVARGMILAAKAFAICRIRRPVETAAPLPIIHGCRRFMVGMGSRGLPTLLDQFNMVTPDCCAGIAARHGLTSEFLQGLLAFHHQGIMEIVSHPGYDDAESRHYSRQRLDRTAEIGILTDRRWPTLLAKRGIKLINYRDV
ncbi:MAG: ChbG/HpnK family deacetylase [Magnetococcales bacterium]|nr:ChbG/HpnK family deacetylase [Magnetococcales bacterium]